MSSELELTLVVENNSEQRNLDSEHGLSFYLTYQRENYVFDTGQGQVLINNLKELDLAAKDLSGILLSHGHYDHAGGLKKLLDYKPMVPVYAHPNIFLDKYSKKSNGPVFRGFELSQDMISNFRAVTDLTEIKPGLWLTGEVPRKNNIEKLNPHYQVKVNDQFKIDPFKDDQSLIVETEKGLVVLLGCSHAGVINILKYIDNNFTQEVYAIIGGMHLINAEQERIEWTINSLKEIGFELLISLHCTGKEAVQKMKDTFGHRVEIKSVGDKIKI